MTASVMFFVPGRPFSKKRPRFGKGRTYTDPETVAGEESIRWYAKRALPAGFEPFAGPVELVMHFRFERAARQAALTRASPWHAFKPDFENLAKMVDALNPKPKLGWAGVWLDDGQVARAEITKQWANEHFPEGTTVKVRAL